MNTEAKLDPNMPNRVEPASSQAGGDPCCRGGQIDIRGNPDKVQEALEESFPASDAPCFTPTGYIDRPPAKKSC